jgi:hypothetical protein
MTPYQYLNTNNNQVTDTVSSPKLDAYLHSLMNGVTVNPYNQQTDENGNVTSDYEVNGIGQATKVGDNRYSIGVDDPSTRGLFNVNVEVDPTTGKVTNLGTTYGSHAAFDWSKPLTFAALVGGGLLAAPYLGGAALFGEGAAAGGGALTGAGTVGADVAGGGAVAGGGGAAGGGSGVGLGSGTSLSADASGNILNGFYGTSNPAVQANLVGSNLVGGGSASNLALLGGNSLVPVTGAGIGGAELGATGGIIGSGAGLGQSSVSALTGAAGLNGFTPNDFMSQPASDYNFKLPNSSKAKTTQQNMANALRSNLDTSVAIKPLQNPFLTNNQQVLANMLKV